MALSPNKGYDLQATGSNNGTWGVVNNANFSIADLNLGGRLSLDVSGSSNVNVTSNQSQNVIHYLTGILTGNIEYIFPALGGFYLVTNATTGSFTLTAKITGGGGGVVVPQGSSAVLFCNPDIPAIYGQVFTSGAYYVGGTSTGVAATQVLASPSPAGFTFANGNLISFTPGFDSAGATTLDINSTGAKAMKKLTAASGFADLASGDLKANTQALILTNSASNFYLLLNPAFPTLGALALLGIGSNFQNNAGNLDFAAAPVLPSATTGTTQAASDNTTKIATTAFVQQEVPAASESAAGKIEIATAAEAKAGSSNTLALTPGRFAGNKSLANSGYYTFPGGFTIQWGITAAVAASSTLTVNYPTPFTDVYSVVVVKIQGAAVNDGVYLNATPGNSSFVIRAGGSGATACQWVAVGLIS